MKIIKGKMKRLMRALILLAILNLPLIFSNTNLSNNSGDGFDANARIGTSAAVIYITTSGNWSTVPGIRGDGGSDNPYIIENKTINGASANVGIRVDWGGGQCFIIRNCTFINCIRALHLDNIASNRAKVNNNTFLNTIGMASDKTGLGIYLNNVTGASITNNIIRDTHSKAGSRSGIGIYLYFSSYNNVTDNSVLSTRSDDATANKVVVSTGMYLEFSSYNKILRNTIKDIICGNPSPQDKQFSGNGIYIDNSRTNYVVNNTISGIRSGLDYYSGNGILMFEASGQTCRSMWLENNTISNITVDHAPTSVDCDYSGNGIAVVTEAGTLDYCAIWNNTISSIGRSSAGAQHSCCGVLLYNAYSTHVGGNKIFNLIGDDRSGCGIQEYYSTSVLITKNEISHCEGSNYYSGIGIMLASGTSITVTQNVINETIGWNQQYCGAGIFANNNDNLLIDNNTIINPTYTAGGNITGAGTGIVFGINVDNSVVSNNDIRGCSKNYGIYIKEGCSNNRINNNKITDGPYGIYCAGLTDNHNDNNDFIENNVPTMFMGHYTYYNIIEDNVVDDYTMSGAYRFIIVGNKNSMGLHPNFKVYEWVDEQFWLKITSPITTTYRGAGGIRLTYKYQSFGPPLSGVTLELRSTSGTPDFTDFYPREDGIMYIPWLADDTYKARLLTTYPSNPFDTNHILKSALPDFSSRGVPTFTLSRSSNSNGLNINGNGGVGGLAYYSTRGSGISSDPYYIENKVFDITSKGINYIGIKIQNTDACFVIKNCTIAGGFGQHGIVLQNVTNGRIEDCKIIGLPSTYSPLDSSSASDPIERGLSLDALCRDNVIIGNLFYRTRSAGILLSGNSNEISNNIISIALNNGINVTGNENLVLNNTITPFAGPDNDITHPADGRWFYMGKTDHKLFGIRLDKGGSSNVIEDNVITGFPYECIIVTDSTCAENTIVGNVFDSMVGRVTNITDNSLDTHFLKIVNPANGTNFIGYGVPYPGYYPGTEGFEDVANGAVPASWVVTGTGSGYYAEVVGEKIDFSGNFVHKKVLLCSPGDEGAESVIASRSFAGGITSGTIEFWVLVNGAGAANITGVGSSGSLFKLMFDHGAFSLRNGTDTITSPLTIVNNYWYRVSIDFTDTGGYASLAAHQYHVKIYNASGDGLLYSSPVANYIQNGTCDIFRVRANGQSSKTDMYLDAIGYSWGIGYAIGDNSLEGILLSQKSQPGYMVATSVGYSLNYGPIVPLCSTGDLVIPLPSSLGPHDIQLHGNDTFGNETTSSIVQFTCYFDRDLFMMRHQENDRILLENGNLTGDGVFSLSPALDLNITIECFATKNSINTPLNITFYFRINNGAWQAPFPSDVTLGLENTSITIPKSYYVLGDTIDYYFSIKHYDLGMEFIQQYYWTSEGKQYFEYKARASPFHKRVCPMPYELTLNYSAFYQADISLTLPDIDTGIDTVFTSLAYVTTCNFSVGFYNTTSTMEEFSVNAMGGIEMDHYMFTNTSIIYNNASAIPIYESANITSPFILSENTVLVPGSSNITIPRFSFPSTNRSYIENLPGFFGSYLMLTYTGIKRDWFYGTRGLHEFKIETGIIDACIRFDVATGIMIYFMYNDKSPNASRLISIGLSCNNQSYPINIQIEKRLECADQWETLLDPELFMILHDPPGDNSFTQQLAGTTFITAYSIQNASGYHGFFDVQITRGMLGIGALIDQSNVTGGSYAYEQAITLTQSFTSSILTDDPNYIGPGKGDLYVGYALFALYRFYVKNYYFVINASDAVNPVDRDLRVYTIGSHTSCTLTPNTTFSVLAPDIASLNMTSMLSNNKFADNMLSEHELSRVYERASSPLYFSGGTVIEFSTSITTTTTRETSMFYTMEAGAFYAFDLDTYASGGVVATKGLATSGRIGLSYVKEESLIQINSSIEEKSIVVHLEDDDSGDNFKIRMYDDLDYGSIGFIVDTASTHTSQPFESLSTDRRPPTTCTFISMNMFHHGTIPLQVIAIDEELRDGNENNIFQIDFYWDDDPVFGTDKTFIGTRTYLQKSPLEDPNIFSMSWDTLLRPTGYYYLFAIAWDIGDELPPYTNYLVSAPVMTYIDNTAPSSCQVLAYGPFSETINLYASTFDGQSGIDYVEYWDGNPASPGSTYLGTGYDPGRSYNFVWATDPDGADDGLHHIYARAYDRAGNSLVSPVLDIAVEQDPAASGIDPGSAILVGSAIIATVIAIGFYLRSRPVTSTQPRGGSRHVPPSMEKEPVAPAGSQSPVHSSVEKDQPTTQEKAPQGSGDVKGPPKPGKSKKIK